MAANKMQPTKVSVTKHIAAVPDAVRRADARALVRMLRRVTGESPRMWGPSIIGFGRYHYTYASGREGDAPLVAFAPRKTATVLYVMTGFKGEKGLLARLGNHKTGKGCLYVKALGDVDGTVLEQLLAKSVAAMRRKYGR